MTVSFSQPIRAIVTGHTRGLGAALAAQLLQRGLAVLGISRRAHPSLATQFGADRFAELALDLSDPRRSPPGWPAARSNASPRARAACC